MKENKKTYSIKQKLSAIFMMVTLLWLTVSAPVIQACQQQPDRQEQGADTQLPLTGNEEESNPFGSNTGGKITVNNSFSEDYIHDCQSSLHLFSSVSHFYKCEEADTYTAYHGELLVPPPNAA